MVNLWPFFIDGTSRSNRSAARARERLPGTRLPMTLKLRRDIRCAVLALRKKLRTVQFPGSRRDGANAAGRLAAIVNSSTDAIVGKTLDGVVTSWNAGATRLFGYSEDEMIGQPMRRLIPGERQEEEDTILAKIAAGKDVAPYDTVRIRKNGQLVEVSVSVSPICDTAGTIIGASKIAHDITRRKEVQRKLAEQEAQLRLFIENAPAPIAMFDKCMRYMAVSRRFIADYGLDEGLDLTGRHHYEVFPEIPPSWRDVHARVLAGEELASDEDSFQRPDGRTDWVRWSMKPWRDAGGNIGGAMLFTEVITGQVKARHAIAESERRFRVTFENAAVGIAHVAPDGGWLRVNSRLCEILGWSEQELLAKNFQDITHPEDLDADLDHVQRMIQGDIDSYGLDKRYLRKDGSYVWTRLRVGAARSPDGVLDYFISAVLDISEQMRTEMALRESEERLRFVADRAEIGYWLWEIEPDKLEWTHQCKQLFGVPVEDTITYERFITALHPEDRERTDSAVRACLESGGGKDYDIEFRSLWPDGTVRWIHAKGGATFLGGRPVRMAGIALDITDRRQTEAALRESEERLRLANEAAEIGTFTVDLETSRALYSPQLAAMLGFPGMEIATIEGAFARVHRDDAARVRQLYNAAVAGADGGHVKMDFRFVRPGGVVRWMTWIGRADFRETAGKRMAFRMVGACLDITERKRQEEQISLLLREVDHRSKNLLTLVQVIARRTAAASPDGFIGRFEERLHALAASQDLLVKSAWKGVNLEHLVRSQLAHFRDLVDTRIALTGPEVFLSAPAAQTIAMAIHELATNAGKYGALSNETGRVRIAWSIESAKSAGENFRMSWDETDGPPVAAPERAGFGSTVLTQLARRGLDADASLSYEPKGLTWRLMCPAANAVEKSH
jgi:PAS domain S-box-containing protein